MVAYHFFPSAEIGARRTSSLAAYLAQHGARVLVVSTFAQHEFCHGVEVLPGVFAVPVPEPSRWLMDLLVNLKKRWVRSSGTGVAHPVEGDTPSGSGSDPVRGFAILKRIYFRMLYLVDGHKRWSRNAYRAARRAARVYGADVMLASGPPFTALMAGARAAGKTGTPFVADFRDPWSDLFGAHSPQRRLELRILRWLERRVLECSAAVTCTTEVVAQLLGARYPQVRQRLHLVRNGFDGEALQVPESTRGRLAILFAGELYLGRDPFPLLEAVDWLVRRISRPESVSVTFMGKCATYAGRSLHTWLRGRACAAAVRILAPQPPEVVREATLEATVLLNLAQGQPLSVPAKTYEQLASGREILLLCESDCETARLVAGIPGVHQLDPADFDALCRALLDLYERHVQQGRISAPPAGLVVRFSRQNCNAAFAGILETVARRGPGITGTERQPGQA